jgi:hypothetical protein
MREEQKCTLYNDQDGETVFEFCGLPEERDEDSLGGGRFPDFVDVEGFEPYVEFHNHPLYRENQHNPSDIKSGIFSHARNNIKINCIGMMRYDGQKDLFCVELNKNNVVVHSLIKSFEKKDFELDDCYGNIKKSLEKNFGKDYKIKTDENDVYTIAYLPKEEKDFFKEKLAKCRGIELEFYNEIEEFIEKIMNISNENWKMMMKIGTRESNIKSIVYVVESKDDPNFISYHGVVTKKAISKMDDVFKNQYGKWLNVERISCE